MVNTLTIPHSNAVFVILTAIPAIIQPIIVYPVICKLGLGCFCITIFVFNNAPLAIMARAPTRPANLALTDARPAMAL
jgi:hypothetical protein